MSIFPWSVARGLKRRYCWKKWMYFSLYNLIFQPYHLLSPLAPLLGEIDIRPRWPFCPKFDAEKLLFKAFFGIVRILTTVRYYHRNKWNSDSLFTTRAIKNGVCLHLCCSSALVARGTPWCLIFLSSDFLEHSNVHFLQGNIIFLGSWEPGGRKKFSNF